MDLIISAATHRTGSTLLQRMFNARDKTLIWGENGGCLSNFCGVFENANHYAGLRHRNAYFNNNEDPNQWIACMTPPQNEVEAAMIETVKAFHEGLYVKNYSDKHDLIGYKEVRYGKRELNLLRKCYPNCTVLLLVRNPVDVWKSLSPRGRKELYGTVQNFAKAWNQRTKDYLDLSQTDPKMHLLRYEDINTRQTETLDLIKKLGRLEDQDIKRVLDKKINSSSTALPLQTEMFIIKRCKKYMKALEYS